MVSVGLVVDPQKTKLTFETAEEAAEFLSSLPPEAGVAAGEWYLDDLEQTDEG